MHYHQLQYIVRTIKKHIQCPRCQSHFHNHHIDIVDIYEEEGLIVLYCEECDLAIEIAMTMAEEETLFSHTTIDDYSKRLIVTEEDVKGVSQQLRSYKGVMKDLFS